LGSATYRLEAYQEAKQLFLEALQIGLETETLVITLRALTEIAALHIRDGAIGSGLELLAHVLSHASTGREVKDRARQLQVELESRLFPQQVESVRGRALARPFEAIVAEVLG
jgi:hypothetical protein